MWLWCSAHLLDNFKSTNFHCFPRCLSWLPCEHSTGWLFFFKDPCPDECMAISRFYFRASEAPLIFFRHIFICLTREGIIYFYVILDSFLHLPLQKNVTQCQSFFPWGPHLPGGSGGAEGDCRDPASSLLGTLLNTWCDTLGGRWVPVGDSHLVLAIQGGMTSPTHSKDIEELLSFFGMKLWGGFPRHWGRDNYSE